MFTQTANPALMNVYDSLNARYGNGSTFLAAQGIDPKWRMLREMLTPQYTTNWSDQVLNVVVVILTVFAMVERLHLRRLCTWDQLLPSSSSN